MLASRGRRQGALAMTGMILTLMAAPGIGQAAGKAPHARNVILFIGDGMGVSTLTAARIYQGQMKGKDGASNRLTFETFPNLALVQTYSADSLVTDSANGASSMLTGHRTINGALGVTDKVDRSDCRSAQAARVDTLAEIAKSHGLSTGAVSTAAITDATPAALYAHVGARSYQGDMAMPQAALDEGCVDIARQLIDAPETQRLDLALGGGAGFFGQTPRRDGRNMMQEFARRPDSAFVDTAQALASLPNSTRHVLGLFAGNNMADETDRPTATPTAPRLVDMTRAAIKVLSRNKKGYFLMVEGALIDKAHHVGEAHEALNEVVEFDAAIAEALALTDPKDTWIIVTADHSHGLTINGGARNSSILGLAPEANGQPRMGGDGKPFTILQYATGPGGPALNALRQDPSKANLADPHYKTAAAIILPSAAHGGEDVAAYAHGPGAENFHGLIDQPAIFQIMRRTLGLPGSVH